ncbi:MAG: cation:proton antiporter [Bacteroidales bacterium]|nr:cation:proton antiporter [Bacteroidales bacterium]
MENISIVTDLALILVTAGIVTLLFKALKQPVVLGYIVAGILISPHFVVFPTLSNKETIEQWSEIGIIFMLFGLGLEFSFKKLIKVGPKAILMAMMIFIGMTVIGLGIGKLLSWQPLECIFLGGILSMSSTTIILKALEDLNLKNEKFAQLIYGTLIVEDLLAVVLMVLLSTTAATKSFSGTEMIWALCKLLAFVIFWFVVGMFIIPIFFTRGKKYINDEMLMVTAIGMCFGMVWLAEAAGFSSALGAFIIGSLLSETMEGERIEHLVKNIKDLFGAVFFVSVGMLVDPHIILQHWVPILVLTITILVFRPLFAGLGVLLGGSGLENSIKTGVSVVALGEFGFIIVGQGVSLGVMRTEIYPIIVAVSVITTFLAPYLMKSGKPLSAWVISKLPPHIAHQLKPIPSIPKSRQKRSEWKVLVHKDLTRMVVYGVLMAVLWLTSSLWLDAKVEEFFAGKLSIFWIKMIITGISLLVISPFAVGMLRVSKEYRECYEKLWKVRLNRGYLIFIGLFKIIIVSFFVLAVIYHNFASLSAWVLLPTALSILVIASFLHSRLRKRSAIETKFMDNMLSKENYNKQYHPMSSTLKEKLDIEEFKTGHAIISQDSIFVGKKIIELKINEVYGINIMKIRRGATSISIPDAEVILYPMDSLLIIGSQDNIDRFTADASRVLPETPSKEKVFVGSFELSSTALLCGKTLKDLAMRKKGCVLICLERDGATILNPSPNLIFQIGDVVWMAGNEESCNYYCN